MPDRVGHDSMRSDITSLRLVMRVRYDDWLNAMCRDVNIPCICLNCILDKIDKNLSNLSFVRFMTLSANSLK